jgi:Glycosyl hydrolase catalytic core
VRTPARCLALVTCGLALCLALASSAVADGLIGVNQGSPLDSRDLNKIAATGVKTDRFMLGWAVVQPNPGTFDWQATDRLVGGSASRGIQAAPFFWGTPSWVSSSPADPPIDSASARQAWESFLRAAVKRYGPSGSYWGGPYHQQFGSHAKALPIKAWQIWTEPNGKAYFAPEPSARRYARLLRISHDAIKAANPQATVVLGGLVGLRKWRGHRLKGIAGWTYLSQLYAIRGTKREFDVAAIHPYAPNLHQLRKEIDLFRSAMRKGGDRRVPLWITELGWGSAPRGSGNSVLDLNKGLKGQSQLLSGAFRMIVNHRRPWRVRHLYWYDWRDPAASEHAPCSFCRTSGLLRHNRTPKPSYNAFKSFVRRHS